jgi:hypothetical protein
MTIIVKARNKKIRAQVMCAVIAALLAVSCFMPLSAYASGISLSPTQEQVALVPGTPVEGKITLNASSDADEEVVVRLYAEPFSVAGDDYSEQDFVTKSELNKMADWFVFPEEEVTLTPGERREVTYKIEPPASAAGGGQYACVFAEVVPKPLPEGVSGLTATSRIGMIVYADVEGERNISGTFEGASFPLFVNGSTIDASFAVANQGNIDFAVEYSMSALPVFMGTMYDSTYGASSKTNSVLPGTKREVTQTWDTATPGIYKITQKINFLGQDYDTTKTVVVINTAVVIMAACLLLVILLLIVRIIVKSRSKSKKKKAKETETQEEE